LQAGEESCRLSNAEWPACGYLRVKRLAGLHSGQGALTPLQVLDHHLAKSITHVHLHAQTVFTGCCSFEKNPLHHYQVFRIKSCLSFEWRNRLVSATFMSVRDYGDVLYKHASSQSLQSLDTVHHGALRFITSLKSLTHHCLLYARVGWSSFSARRLIHWRILIIKSILGLLPSYLLTYISQRST